MIDMDRMNNYGLTFTSQVILAPAPLKVAATEQYLSMDRAQAL